MNSIIYLLQVTACTAVFYLFYYLFLNRLTFFVTNRWYLLATVVLSFLIPLLKITVNEPHAYTGVVQQVVYTYTPQDNIQPVANPAIAVHTPVKHTMHWGNILKFAYLTAVIALTIHLMFTLMAFFKRLKGKRITKLGNVNILSGNEKITNGSFLNYIFLNDTELSPDEIQQIIAHEMLHVKLYHSVDRIIIKLTQIILWFNPFIYLYARSVEENHEFEVDRRVARDTDKHNYANLLLHLSVAGQGMLYHSFSKVPLKKRITMLFNQPSNRMKKIVYVLIVPVVFLSCLAFAGMKGPLTYKKNQSHPSKNQKMIDSVVAVRMAYEKTDDYKRKTHLFDELYGKTIQVTVTDLVNNAFVKNRIERVVFKYKGNSYFMSFSYGHELDPKVKLEVQDKLTIKVNTVLFGLKKADTLEINPSSIYKNEKKIFSVKFKTADTIHAKKDQIIDTVKQNGGGSASLRGYKEPANHEEIKRQVDAVRNKVLQVKVKKILKGTVKGYIVNRLNNDYLLIAVYDNHKLADMSLKPGDVITVGVRMAGWTKGQPVLIWAESVWKDEVKIFDFKTGDKTGGTSPAPQNGALKSMGKTDQNKLMVLSADKAKFAPTVVATDSVYGNNNGNVSYYGNVHLKIGEYDLAADYVRIDTKKQLLFASGGRKHNPDKHEGIPTLKSSKSGAKVICDSLTFNYNTNQGKFWNTRNN